MQIAVTTTFLWIQSTKMTLMASEGDITPFHFPQRRMHPWADARMSWFEHLTLSHHIISCVVATCSCMHTPHGCLHSKFIPSSTEKLHSFKADIQMLSTFLEIILPPKCGDNLQGRNHSSDPEELVFPESIWEMWYYLLQVSFDYVLPLKDFSKPDWKDPNGNKSKQILWNSFYLGRFDYIYYCERRKINFTLILAEPGTLI